MLLPFGVYRADQVGSLLRPAEVLEARKHFLTKDTTQLRTIEDKYIALAVEQQIKAGIKSITDGEFRRAYFHLDFLKQLDGVEVKGQIGSIKHDKDGFSPPQLLITGKLDHAKAIQVEDFKFLRDTVSNLGSNATIKCAIPSPTMAHFRGGRDAISREAYPDLADFFNDLARVYREELKDLYDAGCRMVQLDDTNLAYLCDPAMRQAAVQRGEDIDQLPRNYVKLINEALRDVPGDMTIAIHLCRGNYRSQWFAEGGYEPVAKILFQELKVNAFFLEFDDHRSGDFAPLRFLPVDKVVVLGVMSSKKAELDHKADIIARIKEAAAIVPGGLAQLCLSHQCGFASTMEGNELTEDQQFAKLQLEVQIADEIWNQSQIPYRDGKC